MLFLPDPYFEVLKRRDFFILTLIILIGQVASAFLVLSLIVSIYARTGSNFGVSGVILSFAVPALLLMAFSGLVADIFDRRRTILVANTIIAFVVFVILLSQGAVYASIPLSFLYFAGNAFFIPASSAATAQLVKRSQLLIANTIFIFVLAGGVLFGFFAASVIHYFFDGFATLIVCEWLLILAVILSLLLPPLPPGRRIKRISFRQSIAHIKEGFVYIMEAKIIWFFFLTFALMQGVIVFAATLAPGFFRNIVGLSINRSPIFVLPPVALGVAVGMLLVNRLRDREGMAVSLGVWTLGLALLALGLMIKLHFIIDGLLVLFLVPFLILLGMGVMVIMVASRTVIQKGVSHHHQGTVFGANIILASFLAVLMSPLAVVMQDIFGYINLLILGGALFLASSLVFAHIGDRWKF